MIDHDETAAQRLWRPHRYSGALLWYTERIAEDPGWEGLRYGGALIGEVYPSPRHPGRWQWVVWLGETHGGLAGSYTDARAAMWLELARRPASEVDAIFRQVA